MAYEDWPSEFQEIWETLEGQQVFDGLTDSQVDYAEYMFEEGFMTYEDEKLAPDDISFARSEFWDMLDIDEDFFDWEGWREAMGYD